ncbi:ComF family protein [soil metagenome]
MIGAIRRFRWEAREFLWPRRCAGCGIRGTWLCETCAIDPAPWKPEWCARCGVPTAHGGCRCQDVGVAIDAARSIGWHEGWIRNGVRLLKYHDERARAVHFGELMAGAIADLPRHDVIVAVPLSPQRLRDRGFNQSHELAETIASGSAIPVSTRIVERTIDTPPQVGLPRNQRHQNVQGAFSVVDPDLVRGRSMLIVDDVFTTGATIGEVARALKQSGAARVDAVTVARAGERHPG